MIKVSGEVGMKMKMKKMRMSVPPATTHPFNPANALPSF
jgi:hypothetical protein